MIPLAVVADSVNTDFAKLYTAYQASMYRIAYAILRDEGLAEDAVQQTFLKIFKEFSKLEDINSNKTKSFIVILVRNTAIDLYRKRKRESVVYLDDLEYAPVSTEPDSPEELVITKQSCQELKDAFMALDERYSDILMLRYFHGYRNKEIADLLDMTEAAVASRIFQGKRLLMKQLRGGSNYE